jgi:hypothetical protein
VSCAGTTSWPGANFVMHTNGDRIFLKFGDRRRIAAELKVCGCSACMWQPSMYGTSESNGM